MMSCAPAFSTGSGSVMARAMVTPSLITWVRGSGFEVQGLEREMRIQGFQRVCRLCRAHVARSTLQCLHAQERRPCARCRGHGKQRGLRWWEGIVGCVAFFSRVLPTADKRPSQSPTSKTDRGRHETPGAPGACRTSPPARRCGLFDWGRGWRVRCQRFSA